MKQDIWTQIITYKEEHKCVPNGHGDFDFICPKIGKVGSFVPVLLRKDVNGICECGTEIELEEGERIC